MPTLSRSLLIIFILSFLFYCLDYFFRISQSIIINPLIHQYHTTALGIGAFASAFYLGYALFQLPGGFLLDNFPFKPLLATSILLCSISYAAFLFAHHFWLGYVLRLIVGLTSTLSFMGILFIARATLSSNAFSLVAGLAISIGTLSAASVQIVGVWLMHHWSWQLALSLFALMGIGIGLLFMILPAPTLSTKRIGASQVITQSLQFFKKPILVYNALIGSLFYLPTTLFASLWGVPFLMQTHYFSKTEATFSIFLLFLGWAVGAPIMSWIANQLHHIYRLIRYCALIALCISLLLLYCTIKQHWLVEFIIFALGLASSAQAVVWKLFDTYCPRNSNGIAISWTNMLIMLSGMIFHLCVGYLLTLPFLKTTTGFNYTLGLALIPLAFFIVAISAGCLRSSHNDLAIVIGR